MAKLTPILLAMVALLCAGCEGHRVQSALHPAAPEAAQIARLWWFMFYVCTAVFVLVIGLLGWGLFAAGRPGRPPGGETGFVVAGGIIMPSVVLVGMLIYSLKVMVDQKPPSEGLKIEVTGLQWWWDVYYPEQDIRTANEIYIPVGERVLLEVKAADVVHSLWVPNLHGKIDLLPEKTNTWYLRADRPGIFRGQCAEYCGLQHALMAILVRALPKEEFAAWIRERSRPHVDTTEPVIARGEAVFFEAGCNVCHSIRGTEANGRLGPDLTHIGSRLSLGAGTLTNNFGNLAGWISNPQPLKPGNLMPATYLDGDDLQALAAYLRRLE